ncbi:MAG: acetyl-CoA C-acetyltransferase [Arenicella sp.]|jgi:acetyl-CoA C-acetyltransferase
MNEQRMPVLVACGQVTDRPQSGLNLSPVEMMAEAARAAVDDSGVANLLSSLDVLVSTGLTVDAAQVKTPVSGMYKNVPKTVANLLKISPKRLIYTQTGGNTPQRLVNHFANQIATGQTESVLLTGGEALNNMSRRFNNWSKLLLPKGKWKDNPGGIAETFGDDRPGNSKYEGRYDMNLPAHVYPLFENALRVHYSRSHDDHRTKLGELFAELTKVASDNPYAWFQTERSSTELIDPSDSNRMIAYPYTKLLNSMINVNQSAAVMLMSVAKAKSLGISQDKWVFLHGCADANDVWNVSQRENFHSSPAMNSMAKSALSMANKNIDDMAFFDIYSCFPSAVQIACDEFGISHDDARGLSLTGGLPYFGGPGNNYSMHGIAEMMNRARENEAEFGLLNANGWYLTKHSMGIYSCQVPESDWSMPPVDLDAGLGSNIGDTPQIKLIEKASGAAQMETFTVIYDKANQPKKSIVIARLESGERCLATTGTNPQVLDALSSAEEFRLSGQVKSIGGKNMFSF